jgi:hypothetical protein
VLPLDPTMKPPMDPPEECGPGTVVHQTLFEESTVIDPPAIASLAGEVAVVLNRESLEVVRLSSDVADPDPIATHSAELSEVLELASGADDYHLVTELYTSPDTWVAHERLLGSDARDSWRAGDSVLILGAALSGETVLVAVQTSATTFRIHAAEDVTSTRGATFETPGIVSAVRIFPEAGLVGSWSRIDDDSAEVILHAFDPRTGDPTGATSTGMCGAYVRRHLPFDAVTDGASIYAVVDCEEGTKLLEMKDGAIEASLALTETPAWNASRIALDAAGRIGVAVLLPDALAPTLHVVDPVSLSPMQEPIAIAVADEWATPSQVTMTADPLHAGRWALGHSYIIGHGWGRVRLTRINTCLE